ncbi:hypothetical protein ACT4R9_05210 [Ornithobacterium rhinotracheale]|uniref:hypothetical protein n=1 Tax=Ornithobacterium rhinotracheale TaxID=28251 RepID=UPI003FA4BB9B
MKKLLLIFTTLTLIGCQKDFFHNNFEYYQTDNYPNKKAARFIKNQDTLRFVLAADYRTDYQIAQKLKKDFGNDPIYFKSSDMRKILRRNKIGKPSEQFLFYFTPDYVHLNSLGFYYDKPFPESKLKASKDSVVVREDGKVISLYYPYKNQYVVENFVPMTQGFARIITINKASYNERQTKGFLHEVNSYINDNFRDKNYKAKNYLLLNQE